ncbi:hypothetical protein B7463_g8952, partial [Scytalidium lignicola]
MAPSVLIIGASGNFGRPLVDEFIKNLSKFSKVGILTASSPLKFDEQKSRGIQVVAGSLLDPASYRGFDIVISLAGNSIMRLQPAMIEAAVIAGVTHFYPSEFGSDVGIEALREFRYFRDKRVTRDHLVATAKKNSDFKYTLLITGPFTEWAVDALYGVDKDTKTVNAIARYTVESTLLPLKPGQQKREIRVVGESTTFQGLVDALGEVEGVKYKSIYWLTKDALVEQEKAQRAEDEERVLYWSVRTLGASGNAVIGGPSDNDKFGFTPETARETFQRVYGKH